MKAVSRFGGSLSDNRRKYHVIIWVLLLAMLAGCNDSYKPNTHLLLDKGWKFKTLDDLQYSRPKYNDSDWNSIRIAAPWQKQEYDYVGFAWYRIKIFIPSSLKDQAKSDSIKIFLGDILDAHQLFINGFVVGENGMTVADTHKTDSAFLNQPLSAGPQKYVLTANDPRIQWDKENLIALRVFNRKNNGGMMAGVPYIGMIALEDYIKYNETFYQPDSVGGVDTNLVVTNSFKKPLIGNIIIRACNSETGKEVFKIKPLIQLNSGQSTSIPVSLPITTDQTQLSLQFKEHHFKEIVNDTLVVPFVLVK